MAESRIGEGPKFILTRHEHKISSIGSGSRASVTAKNFNLTPPEGYKVAGVRAVYGGDATIAVYQITPTATGNSNVFRIMNQYGDEMTNKTAAIEILWMKDDGE